MRELGRVGDGGTYGGHEHAEYTAKGETCAAGHDGFGVAGFHEILELWEMGLATRCAEKSTVRRRCLPSSRLDHPGAWALVVSLTTLILPPRGNHLRRGTRPHRRLGSSLMWLCLGGLLRERWDKEERNRSPDSSVVRSGTGKGERVSSASSNRRWVGLAGILKGRYRRNHQTKSCLSARNISAGLYRFPELDG